MAKEECVSGKVGYEQILTEHMHSKEKKRARKCTKIRGQKPNSFENKGATSCVKWHRKDIDMKTNVVGFGDFNRAFLENSESKWVLRYERKEGKRDKDIDAFLEVWRFKNKR